MLVEFKGFSLDRQDWSRPVWVNLDEVAAVEGQDRLNGGAVRTAITLNSGKLLVVEGEVDAVVARLDMAAGQR